MQYNQNVLECIVVCTKFSNKISFPNSTIGDCHLIISTKCLLLSKSKVRIAASIESFLLEFQNSLGAKERRIQHIPQKSFLTGN